MGASVKVTKDEVAAFVKSIRSLTKSNVLVGIPDKNANRTPTDDDPNPPSNAVIGYVQEFGSPVKNIPARPFLIPGVKAAETELAGTLKRTAQAALDGDRDALIKGLTSAGNAAVTSVQKTMTDSEYPPLSPKTVAGRARRGRKHAKQYVKLMKEGVPTDVLDSAGLVRPLVDTGQLRRAITFVIRKK